MPGSIVDLALPGVALPPEVIVDTSLVMPQLLTAFYTPQPFEASRAADFFRLIGRTTGSVGLVTSTVVREVFHFALVARYKMEEPAHRPALHAHYGIPMRPPGQRPYTFRWDQLYKMDATIAQRLGGDLVALCRQLTRAGLLFLQPDDLAPIPSGSGLEQEILRLMTRYGVDSNDAAILEEAQRAGVLAVASLDRDIQRAQADFDVFTWP